MPWRLGSLSASCLEAFDSGLGYQAAGLIDPRRYVANPGYANPLGNTPNRPGTAIYFFTRPGACRTDAITHTDVALDWTVPVYSSAELFLHAQVFNLFNEKGAVAVDPTVLTAQTDRTLAPFDPFTETPKAGVNYRLGPNFGKPTSAARYQSPRTFHLGVGIRF